MTIRDEIAALPPLSKGWQWINHEDDADCYLARLTLAERLLREWLANDPLQKYETVEATRAYLARREAE